MKKKLIPILILMAILIPSQVAAAPRIGPALSVRVPGGPSFTVANVVRDRSITLRVSGYDKKAKYTFSLGNIGNAFGQGTKVGVIDKTFPTNFSVTYKIPSKFRGTRLLGAQLRNNITRARAYDVFENTTGWNSSMPTSLYPDSSSSGDSGGNSVSILGGPTFWVQNVKPQKTVTIKVVDYPKAEKFKVTMGPVGEEFYPGIPVGLLEGNNGREFAVTFAIPSGLWSEPELFIRLENSFQQNFGYTGFTQTKPWKAVYLGPSPGSSISSGTSGWTGGTPYTTILNVVSNGEVTLKTYNFPADKDFIVTMGTIGTRGVGGTVVAIQKSDEGGSFTASYAVPAALQGSDMISIRLQSTTSGHYAYNWFYNSNGNVPVSFGNPIPTTGVASNSSDSTAATTTAATTASTLPLGLFPTFSIETVAAGATVTITTYNLAANDFYQVYIGEYGNLGIGGILVDTVNSGAGGSITVTFTIPAELLSAEKFAIRLESDASGYFAYNWFENIDQQ